MGIGDLQVLNGKSYPFRGYNFCVFMDMYKIGFKTISGLTLRNDSYVAFHEGGQNFSVDLHRDRRNDINHLTLTKGLGSFNPSKKMSTVGVFLLVVFNDFGIPLNAYSLSCARIESVTVSDFDALTSQCIIDTTVIAYDQATEIDLACVNTLAGYGLQTAAEIAEIAAKAVTTAKNVADIAAHNAKVSANTPAEQSENKVNSIIER